jgi:hypothetical protein
MEVKQTSATSGFLEKSKYRKEGNLPNIDAID